MMEDQTTARHWRQQFYRWAWLRSAVWGSVGFGFVWGLVALVTRMLTDYPPSWLWWGLMGLTGVWLAAAWWARRQVPVLATVMAMLDRDHRRGGLLMVPQHTGREAWTAEPTTRGGQRRSTIRWRRRIGLDDIGTGGLFFDCGAGGTDACLQPGSGRHGRKPLA